MRDFMPIQVRADRFVQFRYAPDYLSRLPIYRADPEPCTAPLNLPLTHSDILLDGGNVIRLANCILLSDRVLRDNPVYSPLQLVAELERLLETEVVIFPSDPYERTGHADGMVRYVGGNRLLINHYADFDPALLRKLRCALSPRFDLVELHFGTDRFLDLSWAYLNFLHIGRLCFVPQLGITTDALALRQIAEIIHLDVIPVPARSVVKLGGGLNCISWTIKG